MKKNPKIFLDISLKTIDGSERQKISFTHFTRTFYLIRAEVNGVHNETPREILNDIFTFISGRVRCENLQMKILAKKENS